MKRVAGWLGGILVVLALALFGINVTARPSEAQVKTGPVVNTSNEAMADIIHSYVSDLRPDDPLVQIKDNVQVKTSNYSGITVNGTTYYYQIQPDQSFDPVSRGAVPLGSAKVQQVLQDGAFTIVVYTLPTETAARLAN